MTLPLHIPRHYSTVLPAPVAKVRKTKKTLPQETLIPPTKIQCSFCHVHLDDRTRFVTCYECNDVSGHLLCFLNQFQFDDSEVDFFPSAQMGKCPRCFRSLHWPLVMKTLKQNTTDQEEEEEEEEDEGFEMFSVLSMSEEEEEDI